jgi:hypothetical protein
LSDRRIQITDADRDSTLYGRIDGGWADIGASYLPLTGGTLTGNLQIDYDGEFVTLKNSNHLYTDVLLNSWIRWKDSGGTDMAWIGFGSNSNNDLGIYHSLSGYNIRMGTVGAGDILMALGATGALEITGSSYKTNPTGLRLGQYTSTRTYVQAPASGQVEIWTDSTASIATFKDDKNVDFSGAITTVDEVQSQQGFRVNNTSSTSQIGIALYNQDTVAPTYGIMFTGTSAEGNHGSCNGDWATYFTMNNTAGRGWIFREMSSPVNVASISNLGEAVFNGIGRSYYADDASWDARLVQWVRPPGQSSYYSTTANETGYLKIELPPDISNAMLQFEVHGYNYAANSADTSWGVVVSNYAQSSGAWYTNYDFHVIYGNPPFYTVRFYDDAGDDHFVLLGESTTNWNYPQIEIRNVISGYTGGEGVDGPWNLSISNSTTGLTLKRGPYYAGASLRYEGQSGYNLGGKITVQSGGSPSGGSDGDIYLIY